MIRRLAPVWALVLMTLAGPGVRAQIPFPRDLIPSRTVAGPARAGSPVDGSRTAQRDRACFAASAAAPIFSSPRRTAEPFTPTTPRPASCSGRRAWGAARRMPAPSPRTPTWSSAPAPMCSMPWIGGPDAPSGRSTWERSRRPGPVADEDRVMVGTMDGKVLGLQPEDQRAQGRGADPRQAGGRVRLADRRSGRHAPALRGARGRVRLQRRPRLRGHEQRADPALPRPDRRAHRRGPGRAMEPGPCSSPRPTTTCTRSTCSPRRTSGSSPRGPRSTRLRWSPARTSSRSTRPAI